jgi:tRNA (guanine-N7-)-methyltransferase
MLFSNRRKSFVIRNGRFTEGQRIALDENWSQFGLTLEQGEIDLANVFQRKAKTYLEIGFGMGHSLLALAKAQPEDNFIGVETHKPGVGALLLGMSSQQINNIRVYNTDVIDVLTKGLPQHSLDGVHIFFPDPWPKRKHHPRRLIQPDFLVLIKRVLQAKGTLHLATDWEDYAKHMMKVMSADSDFVNLAGVGQFAVRSSFRPIVTKFEQRALNAGRQIWELQFTL